MPIWLTDDEHRRLTRALDALLPGDGVSPGAGAAGGADFVDQLLSAFATEPPRIWAAAPASAGPASWLALGAVEELAWRTRIEGSQGRPDREFNGPVIGWQQRYRDGLASLGDDFEAVEVDDDERRRRLAVDPEWHDLLFRHACDALYGDPVYGGNRDRSGWLAIGFDGDRQPHGWTDDEVTRPRTDPT